LSSDFAGKGGGGLSFRFNRARKATSALRWGDGPRAFGFSMKLHFATLAVRYTIGEKSFIG
jgi:hypothetical protein